MKSEEYNIGDTIKAKLKEQERSEAWLARKVHCDPGNFNRILKRPSMDLDLLRRMSIALKYNFVTDFGRFVEQQIISDNEKTQVSENQTTESL